MAHSTNSRLPIFMVGALFMLPCLFCGPAQAQTGVSEYAVAQFGTPPTIPDGPLPAELEAAIGVALLGTVTGSVWGTEQSAALQVVAQSGDPRVAWIIADRMRFVLQHHLRADMAQAAAQALDILDPGRIGWGSITDHLIAWDIPAPPDYLSMKREIFTEAEPGWDDLMVDGNIDWRLVTWGGVPIDDRPFGETDQRCACIPAADNPEVSNATEATWLDDDDIVFGIEVNGEYRAYPRRIMEVREMVNDTLGGRDLGIPYCTLCAAAQAYFTDNLPEGVERPVLRTTGLLIRSNKVMYDLTTGSLFDTFRGLAVTGPLAEIGLELDRASVVTTDWGTWRTEHPDTTVLVEALALGRDFDFRNGRDAYGPIFPVGDVDPRLPVHEDVIGVVTASGTPVAFQRSTAFIALQAGEEIMFENVRLALYAGGIRAVDEQDGDLGSHQAFWFAWSQFHPETALWTGQD